MTDRVGLSSQTVTRLRKGLVSKVQPDTLRKVARGLRVSESTVFAAWQADSSLRLFVYQAHDGVSGSMFISLNDSVVAEAPIAAAGSNYPDAFGVRVAGGAFRPLLDDGDVGVFSCAYQEERGGGAGLVYLRDGRLALCSVRLEASRALLVPLDGAESVAVRLSDVERVAGFLGSIRLHESFWAFAPVVQ
jgi:transcriptional regulator with XRE-family HTH domain